VNILLIHNSYQQRGGEDAVFESERDLLLAAGHKVMVYARDNHEIALNGFISRAKLASSTIWAADTSRELQTLLRQERPDVAHFHNTFPLISPSAYYACAKAGVPVVQTLHNYRMLCPGGTFFRDGAACEECLRPSVPWPGVAHGCYRNSHAATAAVATMVTAHRVLKTWRHKIDVYVALTQFAYKKFLEGHLPAERIVVKPNFVRPDPGPKQGAGEYALFVGRLAEEKGVQLLLDAWSQLSSRISLQIAGDGPLRLHMNSVIADKNLRDVSLLGLVSSGEVRRLMQSARFLVLPSIWYEGFPMAIAEAYASAVPVLAPNFGAMAELVDDGVTGLHFSPDDTSDLAAKLQWAWSHPAELQQMGWNARAKFEDRKSTRLNSSH